MRMRGLYFGLTLLVAIEPGIAAQDTPTDTRRPEATAVADASITQSGTGRLAASRSATATVPLAATMMIAPAPVIEPGDEMFIGTGDGSNGFWVRP